MQQIPRQESLEEMQYLKHDELNPIFEEIKVHLAFLGRWKFSFSIHRYDFCKIS